MGNIAIEDITPLYIEGLLSQMREKGLSSRTIGYTLRVLKMALRRARDWGMLNRDPSENVKPPKLRATVKIHPMDAEELYDFLNAAVGHRREALFRIAVDSGMRPEEYLALKWTSVDLAKAVVRVDQVLVRPRNGGGWSLQTPKTAGSRRPIPITPETVELLSRHLRLQNEERLKQGAKYKAQGFVFASPEGDPLHLSNLSGREFKRLLVKAGLDPAQFRLYDLRHTMATLLLAANVHPKIVSERLGHSKIALTLDTYSHVLPSMQQTATDELSRVLGRNPRTENARPQDSPTENEPIKDMRAELTYKAS